MFTGLKMSHSELPVDDKRITIVNPIGASENNNNLVPTANCFMIVPGGAFCFDPYKYTVDGTADQENSTLKGWADTGGGYHFRGTFMADLGKRRFGRFR